MRKFTEVQVHSGVGGKARYVSLKSLFVFPYFYKSLGKNSWRELCLYPRHLQDRKQ